MKYYSQAGQDKWVHDLIGDDGYFVEVGAYDGIQTSNTYALEKLGWKGICVEANPEVYISLLKNRKCTNVHAAVTDHIGEIGFGHDKIGGNTFVPAATLSFILTRCLAPHNIDYLSLDIEGHELTVLRAFPFQNWDIKLLTVEHNLYCDGPAKKEALYELLHMNGFRRMREDVPCLDPNPLYYMQPYEDWYAKG